MTIKSCMLVKWNEPQVWSAGEDKAFPKKRKKSMVHGPAARERKHLAQIPKMPLLAPLK